MNKFLMRLPLQAPADAGTGAAATPPATPPAAAGGAAGGTDAGKPTPAPAGEQGAKDGGKPTDAKGEERVSILGGAADEPAEQGDTKPQDGKDAKDGEQKPADAEAYEVKLPDGVEVDAETLESITPTLKEAGVPADKAGALVAKHVELVKQTLQAGDEAWKKQGAEWGAEVRKEWGPDHAKNTQLTRNAILKFGGKELAADLVEMGLDNHPRLVRAFLAIGKAMSDDSSALDTAAGDAPPLDDDARLSRFYSRKPQT